LEVTCKQAVGPKGSSSLVSALWVSCGPFTAHMGLCAGADSNEKKGYNMPLYEHVFLARQDISTAQVDALIKEYTQVITDGGGKVGRTEYWGLKGLAYKIKKSRKAHYALMNIDSPPPAVAEMERRMGLSTDVIRYITVRVEEHETEPSIQMRKGDRDDRRGDRDGERGGGFRGGERGGGFGGDRPRREGGAGGPGGGFRGDRPPRDGAPRGDRPPREAGAGPRPEGGSTFRPRPPAAPGAPAAPAAARPPRTDSEV
jgi:small subunit ribosomal protein S6